METLRRAREIMMSKQTHEAALLAKQQVSVSDVLEMADGILSNGKCRSGYGAMKQRAWLPSVMRYESAVVTCCGVC